jgi:large repetitive protein
VLAAGKATLVASYLGDLGFRGSAASAPLTVQRAASRTTLTLPAPSVKYGVEMSLKITVAVAPQFSGTPAGNVVVSAGKVTLCTVRLASATHTCTLPSERALSAGRHALIASYPGSADFAPSSATKTLTVNQATTPGSDALRHWSACGSLPMILLQSSSGCRLAPAATG